LVATFIVDPPVRDFFPRDTHCLRGVWRRRKSDLSPAPRPARNHTTLESHDTTSNAAISAKQRSLVSTIKILCR
jgi:hypothetical protein